MYILVHLRILFMVPILLLSEESHFWSTVEKIVKLLKLLAILEALILYFRFVGDLRTPNVSGVLKTRVYYVGLGMDIMLDRIL